jgi:hypothetical protein
MKGHEKPKTRNIPLPTSGELVAKSGKNDLIVIRLLPTGELRYCTHPDVTGVVFKTLSADYRQFDLIDEEETKRRISSMNFWKEHGGTILVGGMIAIFVIMAILLMNKFVVIEQAAAQIVAQMKELSCAQVITG